MCCCLVVVLLVVFLSKETHPSIFVYSSTGETFDYEVKNTRVLVTGSEYDFKTKVPKKELFAGIASQFELVDQNDTMISVRHNGEIFTVEQVPEEDNRYILYAEG